MLHPVIGCQYHWRGFSAAMPISSRTHRFALLGAAATTALVGLLMRWWVLRSELFGYVDADEAVTGLMAANVLRGHLPVLVAGNRYGGTAEAFLLAPLFAVFGARPLLLKGLAVALWAVASWLVYRISRRVSGLTVGAMTGLIFWVLSGTWIVLSTFNYSGYLTGLVATLVAIDRSLCVVESASPSSLHAIAIGFASGFAIWSHPMFLSVLLPALAVVSWRLRRHVRQWWLPTIAGGLVALAPWLTYGVTRGFDQGNSSPSRFSYVGRLRLYSSQLIPKGMFGQRSWGAADQPLPRGAGPSTGGADWVLGAGGKVIYLAGLGVIVTGLMQLVRLGWAGRSVAAAAIVSPLIMAAFGPLWFTADGRYSIVFVAPMAVALGAGFGVVFRQRASVLSLVPLGWSLIMCLPVLAYDLPAKFVEPDRDLSLTIAELDDRYVTSLSGDYWHSTRITFATGGRIAVVNERFPYLGARLRREHESYEVSYVFYGPVRDNPLDKGLLLEQYQRIVHGPFILYLHASETRDQP